MTTRSRLQKIEKERGRRAAAVGQRIVKQLSDDELDRLAVGFEGFSDSDLERIAAGAFAPQVEAPPIAADVLERLAGLCESDSERRWLGLPIQSGFTNPHRVVNFS